VPPQQWRRDRLSRRRGVEGSALTHSSLDRATESARGKPLGPLGSLGG
jgi:hypothetical protein